MDIQNWYPQSEGSSQFSWGKPGKAFHLLDLDRKAEIRSSRSNRNRSGSLRPDLTDDELSPTFKKMRVSLMRKFSSPIISIYILLFLFFGNYNNSYISKFKLWNCNDNIPWVHDNKRLCNYEGLTTFAKSSLSIDPSLRGGESLNIVNSWLTLRLSGQLRQKFLDHT